MFVDADDVVAPGYLAAIAAALEQHEFVTAAFDQESLNPEWVRWAHGPPWREGDEPLVDQFGVLPNAGASMGITREDQFKRLKKMQDAGRIMADVADLAREHRLPLDLVEDVVLGDLLGEQPLPLGTRE